MTKTRRSHSFFGSITSFFFARQMLGKFSVESVSASLPSLLDYAKGFPPYHNTGATRSRSNSGSAMRRSGLGRSIARTNSAIDAKLCTLMEHRGYRFIEEWDRTSHKRTLSRDGTVVALKLFERTTNGRKSRELDILQYLQAFRSAKNLTIELLHTFGLNRNNVDEVIVMPWLPPLKDYLKSYVGDSRCLVVSFRLQLLEGVQFLHDHFVAHLDLKPDNILVGGVDSEPRLSIIDFGLSVWAENEDVLVGCYRGTPSWSAPEVGEHRGPVRQYSAVLADRYSCGRVLQYLTEFYPASTPTFPEACRLLLHSDPRMRPPLDKIIVILKTPNRSSQPRASAHSW